MAEDTQNPSAAFVWYELMTNDADAATAFYGAVVGWTVEAVPGSPMDYRMIQRSSGVPVGGLLPLSDAMRSDGAHPAWMPYLHVPDVDAAVAAVEGDGGKVLMPRHDIPEGSFAMVSDPFGTPFYLMKPNPPADRPDAVSTVFTPDQPQSVRWNELSSPDRAGALAFYARHFGFESHRSMPMGSLGDYCFIEKGGVTLGAIMQRPEEQPGPPMWLAYFGVPDAFAARDAIVAGGGTVMFGPQEVPGGEYSLIALDPQGAVFGVVGPKGA